MKKSVPFVVWILRENRRGMEALNKKLQELKETLVQDMSEEEIEKLYALPEVELLEKLNKRNHELGKRQSRYSMNSKEYTDLGKQRTLLEEVTKILRQREKEKSSLMAASDETEEINEPKEKKEIIYSREYMKQLHDEYQKLFEKNDLKSMRSLYLKVYRDFDKEPESVALLLGAFEETQRRGKGNVIGLLQFTKQREDKRGIYSLARAYRYGTLVPKSLSKSKYYLQQAVELESSEAIFELACELCGLSENYGYEIQKEEGYQQFKRYVQLRAPLDISNRRDQKALYNCYYQGAQLGHDMEKENIAVPWQWLLKCEGEYKELGKNLPGEFFVTQNRYEEAVQAFLDADNVYGIQQVKLYLFHSYFKERPELQRKLEVVLEKLRDNPNTKSEIRAELFEWYARRYENGERVVKNYAIAYAYYLKLLRIKMSNNAVERMNEITKEFSPQESPSFVNGILGKISSSLNKEFISVSLNSSSLKFFIYSSNETSGNFLSCCVIKSSFTADIELLISFSTSTLPLACVSLTACCISAFVTGILLFIF